MHDTVDRSQLEAALAGVTARSLARGETAGHIALTLFAATMGAGIAGVLATQAWLPVRTAVALWFVLAILAGWVLFGLGILSRRRPLLANREVRAARLALLFSVLFTAGTMAVGWINAGILVPPATWLGVAVTAVASAGLARAHWRRARLLALRGRLERELAAR